MFNDNFSYFKSDNKCYNSKLEQENANNYLDSNFDSYTYNLLTSQELFINDCKNKAIESNKDFFLVGDFDKNTRRYKCLIPKKSSNCDISNISSFLTPYNEIIDTFLEDSNSTITSINYENNSSELPSDLNGCFKLENSNGNSLLSTTNKYILYKTEFVDNTEYINSLNNVKSYNHYKNIYNNNFSDIEYLLNSFSESFSNYVCNPTDNNNELDFEEKLLSLKEKFNELFSSLDNISRDISTLSVLTNYDTKYLQQLQEQINVKKKDLKTLLTFDGANNGKLKDSKFLKNMLLSEVIIVILLVVLAIFLYKNNRL